MRFTQTRKLYFRYAVVHSMLAQGVQSWMAPNNMELNKNNQLN